MKNLIYFILLYFCQILSVYGQNEIPCNHPDSSLAINSYEKAKKFLSGQTNYDSALYFMQKSKVSYQGINCWEQAVKMSYNIAVIYSMLKENDKADKEIKNAETVAEKELPNNSRWKGKIKIYLAEKKYQAKAYTDAEKLLIAAIDIFRSAKAWKDCISAYRLLAQVYLYTQDYSNMEASVNEAYNITKTELGNDPNLIKSIMQLYGALYYKTGDYESALKRTLEGLDVLERNMKGREDSAFVASYYNNIGLFYLEIGEVVKAEDYSLNALNLSLKLDDKQKAATIYQNLAQFFYEKQQFEKSFSYSNKCLKILQSMSAKEMTSDMERSSIQMNIGLARAGYESGKKDIAFSALEENVQMHKKSLYHEEKTYMTLGQLYYKEKDSIKANYWLNMALEKALKYYSSGKHPTVGEIYFTMAQNADFSGNSELALQMLQNCYEALYTKTDQKNDFEDLNYINDKNMLLKALELESKILKIQAKLSDAYQVIIRAAKITDELRNTFKSEGSRLFLQQKLIPVYEQAMEIALDLYHKNNDISLIEKCFELSEKSKSMLLLDAFRTEDARAFGDVPESLLKEEKRLTREIAKKSKLLFEAEGRRQEDDINKIRKEILELRKKWQDLEKTLETEYNNYYRLKYSDKTATLKDVQHYLSEGTVLLEYFIGNTNIYLFSISKKDFKLHQFKKDQDFENQITTLRKSLTDIKDLKVKKTSEQLFINFSSNAYSVFEKYVSKAIPENTKELIIIPDGLLNYIPFDVLLSEKAAAASFSYKNLAYLLHKYSVHYHYSASLMLYDIKKTDSNGRLLAMAPTYQFNDTDILSDERQKYIRNSVEELPGAKEEVRALQKIYSGNFLFGKDANEKNFKRLTEKENFAVVHLAMHGWVDEKQPPLSNLVLSHSIDSSEDNLLHAYELNLLKINADLVVLSACETGFGKYERGEGVVSIGRGFMYAGVPSVLMTLWPINDRATAILVTEFYRQLSMGKTKSEALRNAKLLYIEKADERSAHPFFWAAFVSLGDDRPVHLNKKGDWIKWVLLGMGGVGLILLSGYWAGNIKKPIQISKKGATHQHH
jgi:CHAT domain-containing protein/tetratricopeptide (TPR) repeat protein